MSFKYYSPYLCPITAVADPWKNALDREIICLDDVHVAVPVFTGSWIRCNSCDLLTHGNSCPRVHPMGDTTSSPHPVYNTGCDDVS